MLASHTLHKPPHTHTCRKCESDHLQISLFCCQCYFRITTSPFLVLSWWRNFYFFISVACIFGFKVINPFHQKWLDRSTDHGGKKTSVLQCGFQHVSYVTHWRPLVLWKSGTYWFLTFFKIWSFVFTQNSNRFVTNEGSGNDDRTMWTIPLTPQEFHQLHWGWWALTLMFLCVWSIYSVTGFKNSLSDVCVTYFKAIGWDNRIWYFVSHPMNVQFAAITKTSSHFYTMKSILFPTVSIESTNNSVLWNMKCL